MQADGTLNYATRARPRLFNRFCKSACERAAMIVLVVRFYVTEESRNETALSFTREWESVLVCGLPFHDQP